MLVRSLSKLAKFLNKCKTFSIICMIRLLPAAHHKSLKVLVSKHRSCRRSYSFQKDKKYDVYAFGLNYFNQCFNSSVKDVLLPARILEGISIKSITSGWAHNMLLDGNKMRLLDLLFDLTFFT